MRTNISPNQTKRTAQTAEPVDGAPRGFSGRIRIRMVNTRFRVPIQISTSHGGFNLPGYCLPEMPKVPCEAALDTVAAA